MLPEAARTPHSEQNQSGPILSHIYRFGLDDDFVRPAVAGRVVYHDDLIGYSSLIRKRCQAPRQFPWAVAGADDNGNHQVVRYSSRPFAFGRLLGESQDFCIHGAFHERLKCDRPALDLQTDATGRQDNPSTRKRSGIRPLRLVEFLTVRRYRHAGFQPLSLAPPVLEISTLPYSIALVCSTMISSACVFRTEVGALNYDRRARQLPPPLARAFRILT